MAVLNKNDFQETCARVAADVCSINDTIRAVQTDPTHDVNLIPELKVANISSNLFKAVMIQPPFEHVSFQMTIQQQYVDMIKTKLA